MVTSARLRKVSDMTQPARAETDTSTRQRILLATAEVLGRNGKTKLSLSEVAAQAGVSRPTLYRWFASKEELLSAFSNYERQFFEGGLVKATAGLKGSTSSTPCCDSSSTTSTPTPVCAWSMSSPSTPSPMSPASSRRCETVCNGTFPDPMPR